MRLISPASKKRISRRLARFLSISFLLLDIAVLLTYFSLPVLGNWLVREDPIQKADAIAVLTGHFPDRAVEAAQLYQSGYASEIWLTHPKKGGVLDEYGELRHPAEDSRNFEVLRSFGVPEEAIRVLDLPIVNTADELNAIGSGLKQSGGSSVIIVTSKAHTRRVYSLWDKYHAGDGAVVVRAESYDDFTPSCWWQTSSTRSQGVHELLGMINVWAGMPVHRPLQTTALAAAPTRPPLSKGSTPE
ncbi:MAG: ElyC/SanA/YdcF family protein [Candidatus Acidiferrum sp.]